MCEISIVVPVYNVEKYIKRCIDSILNQTFKNFELILINDGSTDKSRYICDSYAQYDKRIKVIYKDNSGVSATRNLGISKSKGKYIQFIDPDDWIEKNLLRDAYKIIERDNSDIIFWGMRRESFSNGKITEKVASKELINSININKNYDAINLMKEDLFGFTWCKLFKLSIIKKNNILFDERLSLAEDEEFTCNYYSYVKKISILKKCYYHYIIYGNERNTLCKTKINSIFDKDIIFASWIKCLSNNSKDFKINKFLTSRAFYSLYEELWNICYSKVNNSEKKLKIKELKETYFYNYFIKNINNIEQFIFMLLIKHQLVYSFKLYNKIRYKIKVRNS